MYGELVPCGGGSPIALVKPRVVVGRLSECDVMLPYGTVSSQHCLLELRDRDWHVADLSSRNGVRVNGVKCEAQRLPPGSILSIAQHRFEIAYGSAQRERPSREGSPQPQRPRQSDSTMIDHSPAAAAKNPARAAALGELIPCGGGAPIPLNMRRLVIGRLPACDVSIPNATVSAKHCELEFKEGYWHVRDLGSRNGIRVNGERHRTHYLKPGDILSVAKTRFEIAFAPQADEPPPEENPFAMSLLEKAGLTGHDVVTRDPAPAADDRDTRKRWVIDERE